MNLIQVVSYITVLLILACICESQSNLRELRRHGCYRYSGTLLPRTSRGVTFRIKCTCITGCLSCEYIYHGYDSFKCYERCEQMNADLVDRAPYSCDTGFAKAVNTRRKRESYKDRRERRR